MHNINSRHKLRSVLFYVNLQSGPKSFTGRNSIWHIRGFEDKFCTIICSSSPSYNQWRASFSRNVPHGTTWKVTSRFKAATTHRYVSRLEGINSYLQDTNHTILARATVFFSVQCNIWLHINPLLRQVWQYLKE